MDEPLILSNHPTGVTRLVCLSNGTKALQHLTVQAEVVLKADAVQRLREALNPFYDAPQPAPANEPWCRLCQKGVPHTHIGGQALPRMGAGGGDDALDESLEAAEMREAQEELARLNGHGEGSDE